MTPWVAVAESEEAQSCDSRLPERSNPVSSVKLAMVKWFISLKDSRPLPEFRGCTGEPGWDVLLDLYLGELLGRKTSVTSACIASGVPPTTALRYVNALCDAGRIERDRDENDARRCWLKLAPQVREEIDSYLEATLGHALAIVKAGA
ncbi:MarR family winged helix-turn-helix transcriptional regulator [Novosphingobium sp. G106]|uniref:MarR family winged helix-turn-helix transcriptional regulator n=1 Tax=Novosphingobium sp. G106 TaxID=2849500 RepID=UPI001C2CD791|nr:MarR family winged helix-turn-helix transcriptional regulator [Novosphingobium sp. G106]MBV1691256.1 MarR family winged helix-turn-helix transcriptional regulator [Novosphingobium sp. G106]